MKRLWILLLAACLMLAGSLAAQTFQPNFLYQPSPAPSPEPDPDPDPEPWWFQSGSGVLVHSGHSFLGVGIADVNANRAKELKLSEVRGVEITKVEPNSPADKAGVQKGDVILEYNGQRVIGMEQLVRLVRETPAGRTVSLVVSRDGNVQNLSATIETRKGPAVFVAPKVDFERLRKEMEDLRGFRMPDVPRTWMSWRSTMLGVEAESIEGQLADYFGVKEGVLVRSVMKDSAAQKAGVQAGDIITKVDEEKVTSPREVSRIISKARSKTTFPITVVRSRKEMTLTVTLERPEQSRGRTPAPARVIREQRY